MNKYLSLALVLMFFGATAFAQKGLPTMKDYKEFGLKSKKVEKVRFKVMTPNNIVVETEEIYFDEKGYRNKEVIISKEGNTTTTWEYNSKEKTVNMYRLSPMNKTLWKRTLTYNSKINKVSMNHFAPWRDLIRDTLIDNTHYYTRTWTLDKNKTKIERDFITLNIREGRIASATSDFVPASKYNTVLQNTDYVLHEAAYNWLYDYSESFLKAKTIKSEANDNTTTYYVNKKGLPFETKVVSNVADKQLLYHTTYDMEYDKQKNWVKLTQLENGIPKYIVTREITYRSK